MRLINPFLLSGYAGLMLLLIGLNAAFIFENVSTATGGMLFSAGIAIILYVIFLSPVCIMISKQSPKKH